MGAHNQWKIFLSDLTYDEEEEQAVLEVIRSRWLTMGPRTEAFEKRVAEYVGCEHAICLSSCTAGLYLLLKTLDVGPGDEVLVPSLTFVATVNVIVNIGAVPIFCDIVSPELPLIDPEEIRNKLSPATRAVYTMDYAGYPCDYDSISDIISEYETSTSNLRGQGGRDRNIHLFEDAAHGIGGALDAERSLGNCADAGVFSFFSNKNVATGEGGMVVTNQAHIAERVHLLRRHGLTHSTWERHLANALSYDVELPGWNFRPTEITSALGLVQMSKLDRNQERRHELVRRYQTGLAQMPEVTVPFVHIKTWHYPACHVFPILLPDSETRNRVRDALHAAGIQTSHHYPPVHLFEYYQRSQPTAQVELAQTEQYASRELTLPLHPRMTVDQVEWIVGQVAEGLTP